MAIAASTAQGFIKEQTTIREFYDFITNQGVNFSYDINKRNYDGLTALHKACLIGNTKLAQAIINMGGDKNCHSNNYEPPLYSAIQNGHFNTVKMLIENGVSIHDQYTRNLPSNYHIQDAIDGNHHQIKDYLIKSVSNTLKELIANKIKYNPTFFAVSKKAADPLESLPQDIKNLLVLEGSDAEELKFEEADCKYYELGDAIKSAVINNNLAELHILLNDSYVDLKFINVNMKDSLTRTAVNHNNLEMVQLLVRHGDETVESNHIRRLTTSEAARNAGNVHIADYLDQVQTDRYQRLLDDADKQSLLNADKHTSNPSLHAP